jgi:HEAT repeat protein
LKKIIIILSIALLSSACAKKINFKADKEGQNEIKTIASGLNSSNWQERLKTVKYISKQISTNAYDSDLTDDVILNLLIKATSDSHETVTVEAIKGLSVLKYPEAMEILAVLSLDDKNSNKRWYAIQALSLYKNSANIPVFIKGLKSEDWLIREASIKGLLYLDKILNNEYIPVIIAAINDQNESVRIAALQNLKIKDEKLYETIKKIFINKKNDMRINLIKAALIALEGYTLDDKVKERTIELLTDRNSDIRILSLRVLKKDYTLRKFPTNSEKESLKEIINKKISN